MIVNRRGKQQHLDGNGRDAGNGERRRLPAGLPVRDDLSCRRRELGSSHGRGAENGSDDATDKGGTQVCHTEQKTLRGPGRADRDL